ncbi:PH domain-containing protein [Clostridium baratii]|uniref:Membrane flanked domain-containing protein n=1 Tax=Clostridium baratii TaxID=1561 RepID=A0A174Q3M8_9CLOT|nr:membrane flanked domain-containing protein [Clostridium baratii]
MDKPFRSHFSIIFENSISFLFIILLFFINIFRDFFNEIKSLNINNLYLLITDNLIKILFIFILLLLIISVKIFINYLMWRKTFMYLDNSDFVYERNSIFKCKKNFPLKNIASVNINQSIFQRLIGTSSLKFDLNSSLFSDTSNIKIVLKKEVAKELQDLILLKISKINVEDTTDTLIDNQIDTDSSINSSVNTDSIIDFTLIDVIKHSVFNLSTISIFFTLTALIPLAIEIFDKSTSEPFLNTLYFVAVIIIFQGVSIFLKILKYYDFKVNRNNNIISLSYGLFNKKAYSFSINKINAIVIKRSLLCRIFKMYSLQGMVAGLSDDGDESPCLSLCVNKQQLDIILNTLLPEFKNDGELINVPKSSFYIKLLHSLVILIPFIILSIVTKYFFIFIPVLVILIAYSYFKFKNSNMIIGNTLFTFSKGAFDISITTIQYKKIQLVNINSSPLKNLFKVKTGNFSCISDSFNFIQSLGCFKESSFNKLVNKLF